MGLRGDVCSSVPPVWALHLKPFPPPSTQCAPSSGTDILIGSCHVGLEDWVFRTGTGSSAVSKPPSSPSGFQVHRHPGKLASRL